jgi:AcrR family transcriptional regulator
MPKISVSAKRALIDERKKQILDAATRVFAEKGFAGATISDIAEKAGIAEGSIYNYFKNKNDLLVSLPRQMIEPTITNVSARMSMTGVAERLTPEQMLTMVAKNIIGTIRQNAPVFRALVSALPSMKQAQREKYLNQVVMYATGVLETYFVEQIKLGVFCPHQNPTILARAFVGMFFPYLVFRELLQVETDADWTYDQIIAEIVPLFLRGVMKPGQVAMPKSLKRIPLPAR